MMTIYDKEAMLGKLKDEFAAITALVETAVGQDPICDVEREVFRTLQQLGRSLLEYFIAQSGTGYQAEHPPRATDGTALTFKGLIASPYFSIFGEVTIPRAAYAGAGPGYVYPLDAQLNLPASKYSYLLEKWVLARAAETDFREAVALFNEMFEFALFPAMPQRLCATVAPAVAPFYVQSAPPTPESEGSHLAISADGKGVRILKAERQDPATPSEPPKARRGKGEKPGIKKQAVVTVDCSFTPESREPEAIVHALLHDDTPEERQRAKSERQQRREAGEQAPRVACNKHVRATLQGKAGAMSVLMDRVLKRDPTGTKRIIALLDGDPALETAMETALTKARLSKRVDAVILDLIHVSEYVWDVGTALYGEKDPQRVGWVREKLVALLHSEVGRVIGGLKQTLTKTDLRPTQQAALHKTITYFENHRHMMDYATYLAKGYPIATGLVEGTCGSLVKDRMEHSGMRWSIRGAQAVLALRAVKQNHDWDQFWQYHIASEKARLYGDSSTVHTESYPKAA
jgi:hypothetical protein